MNLTQVIVRFAVTPAGAAFDRYVVRFTGHSLVSWAFARANGVEYNAPLLLTTIGARYCALTSGRDDSTVIRSAQPHGETNVPVSRSKQIGFYPESVPRR